MALLQQPATCHFSDIFHVRNQSISVCSELQQLPQQLSFEEHENSAEESNSANQEEERSSPSFVMDHLSNISNSRVREISVIKRKTPWSKKFIHHSPFPKITKISSLTWVDRRTIAFIGWEAQGQMCAESKVFKLHQSRNKFKDDSIMYQMTEVSKPFKKWKKELGVFIDIKAFNANQPDYFNFLKCFNTSKFEWEHINNVQGIRPPSTIGSTQANVTIDDQNYLYVFGGEAEDGTVTTDLWCYNISERSTKQLNRWRCISTDFAPPKLHHHSMIVRGDYLIVFGGKYEKMSILSNELWGFNMISEHWFQMTTIGTLPPLENAKLTIGNNSLFIYGGQNNKGDTNDTLYIYNLWSHHLYHLPAGLYDSPGKLENFEMTYDNDLRKLILFGGYQTEHKRDLIHDCNETVYNYVYELNWSMLKDFVIAL